MYPHHQQTIERLTAHLQQDPNFLALIIGGSVAKGWAAENSDVDVMLVATDEEYARRLARSKFSFYTKEFCDYEEGYVDGKVIDLQFLREVALHGSEPARAAFVKSSLAYSNHPEIETLIQQIPVYPEAERDQKLKSFYSQVVLVTWYVGEAQKRNDTYLMTRMSADLVLYGGRLMLAYNRILYPYHKWFMKVLQEAPEKPANFMELAHTLLKNPNKDAAQAFCDCITQYQDWDVSIGQAVVNFMFDREWTWREPTLALEDR